MKKIATDFIINQYQSGVENYATFTTEIGLWASEEYVFTKYLSKTDKILDLGCGTGRTTFPLYQLGYQQIIGVDLTPEMIEKAIALNDSYQAEIDFIEGDAKNLKFEDNCFDAVIFSFNGLMSIPELSQRKIVVKEINRVLKPTGLFLFTTHDRDKEAQYFDFWRKQRKIWDQGKQDEKLHEFGDLITVSKNEISEIFIHIPNQEEVEQLLRGEGFKVIETFYRSDKFQENEKVKEKSGECRFWIAQKVYL